MREWNNLLDRACVLGIEDHGKLIREHMELNAFFLPSCLNP